LSPTLADPEKLAEVARLSTVSIQSETAEKAPDNLGMKGLLALLDAKKSGVIDQQTGTGIQGPPGS